MFKVSPERVLSVPEALDLLASLCLNDQPQVKGKNLPHTTVNTYLSAAGGLEAPLCLKWPIQN